MESNSCFANTLPIELIIFAQANYLITQSKPKKKRKRSWIQDQLDVARNKIEYSTLFGYWKNNNNNNKYAELTIYNRYQHDCTHSSSHSLLCENLSLFCVLLCLISFVRVPHVVCDRKPLDLYLKLLIFLRIENQIMWNKIKTSFVFCWCIY